LAVVVQPRPPGQTVVRANASLLGVGRVSHPVSWTRGCTMRRA
jgi:hypothetical protein